MPIKIVDNELFRIFTEKDDFKYKIVDQDDEEVVEIIHKELENNQLKIEQH